MPSAVATAVETYVRTFDERDPAIRAAMLEACFAPDVRMVARTREVRGRAEMAAEITRLVDDPRFLRVRLASAIDAQGSTFRFRSVVEFRDGTSLEFFDAGQIDENGRIALILAFAGPLADADEPPATR
jgi:hypothetical protein